MNSDFEEDEEQVDEEEGMPFYEADEEDDPFFADMWEDDKGAASAGLELEEDGVPACVKVTAEYAVNDMRAYCEQIDMILSLYMKTRHGRTLPPARDIFDEQTQRFVGHDPRNVHFTLGREK